MVTSKNTTGLLIFESFYFLFFVLVAMCVCVCVCSSRHSLLSCVRSHTPRGEKNRAEPRARRRRRKKGKHRETKGKQTDRGGGFERGKGPHKRERERERKRKNGTWKIERVVNIRFQLSSCISKSYS